MAVRESQMSLIIETLDLRAGAGLSLTPGEFLNIRNAGVANTLRLFCDALSRPIGYVSWANVSGATIRRLSRSGRWPFYLHEWREGGICLITDVMLVRQHRSEAIRHLRTFSRMNRVVVVVRVGKPLRLYRRRGSRFIRYQVSVGGRVVRRRMCKVDQLPRLLTDATQRGM
jgi:hemolysin-activating ACP:hemolysin acyltransferase